MNIYSTKETANALQSWRHQILSIKYVSLHSLSLPFKPEHQRGGTSKIDILFKNRDLFLANPDCRLLCVCATLSCTMLPKLCKN